MHVYIPRDTESSQEEVHCNIPVYPSAYIQNIVDNICVNAETWNAKPNLYNPNELTKSINISNDNGNQCH